MEQLGRSKPLSGAGFLRMLNLLPFMIPSAFVAFSCVAMGLLLIGQLRTALVWPLGLIAAAIAVAVVARAKIDHLPGSVNEIRWVGIAALLFILVWSAFNTHYASQNIFMHRDPAIYTNNGEWLKNHTNLYIQASNVFGNNSAIYPDSASFNALPTNPQRLYPGAMHLLPIYLGLAARLGGSAFMFHINAFFGGLALLVLYGFVRCFAQPRWALLVILVLASCLPMIYFSRDNYSEPIDMLLVFGALSLLWLAQKNSSKWLWLLAGLTAGATTMSRIDTYLIVAAFLASLFILLMLTKVKDRVQAAKNSGAFVIGMFVTTLIGYLDLTRLSARYYHDLRHQVLEELTLILFVSVCGLITLYLAWQTDFVKWLDTHTKNWRVPVSVGILVLGVLVLLSRPLWLTAQQSPPNPLVAALQASSGAHIDAIRTYAEWSVYWLGWYIGPVLSVFGFYGICLVTVRFFKKRSYLSLLPFFVVFIITAVLYLNLPNITPDQVWASRRFLPVVFPGLCLFAAIAFETLYDRNLLNVKQRKWLGGSLVVLLFAAPLFISRPFLRIHEYVPELTQINAVCAHLPPHAAVLLLGQDAYYMTQPVRGFCQVPAERLESPTTPLLADAARAATNQGYVPVIAVYDLDTNILPVGSEPQAVSTIVYRQYAMDLTHPPIRAYFQTRTILLGRLNANGNIVPLVNN
jgi:hypothetical protein